MDHIVIDIERINNKFFWFGFFGTNFCHQKLCLLNSTLLFLYHDVKVLFLSRNFISLVNKYVCTCPRFLISVLLCFCKKRPLYLSIVN